MSTKLVDDKGQSVMIDLFIGMTIFLLVLSVGLVILDNQVNAVKKQQEILQQQKTAETALNQLVSSTGSTTGNSPNWEAPANTIDDVKFLGLALTDRIILPAKINKFKGHANSDYEKTKSKLLIGQDFYFRLIVPGSGEPGTTMAGCTASPDLTGNCEAGKKEEYLTETEGKKIVSAMKHRRAVAFNGGSAIAEIIIFNS